MLSATACIKMVRHSVSCDHLKTDLTGNLFKFASDTMIGVVSFSNVFHAEIAKYCGITDAYWLRVLGVIGVIADIVIVVV